MQFLSEAGKQKLNLQIETEFTCSHERPEITVLISKDNRPHYRTQCLECGRRLKVLKQSDLSRQQMTDAKPFDGTLEMRFWERRARRRAELEKQMLHEERQVFNLDYDSYRASPKWQALRTKVLRRDNYICQGCGVHPAVDVHHLTYERLYDEMLFDLISVCRRCHSRLHPEHSSDVAASDEDLNSDSDSVTFDDDESQ